MKEGNKKEMIESKREEKRKEKRVRERKLEKDLKRRRKKKSAEERTYRTLWPDALASYLPLCTNLKKKKLIHHFLIWGDSRRLRLHLPGPKSPHFAPKASQSVA